MVKLVAVYEGRGIAMHFDLGDMYASNVDPSQNNLGGGNVVAFTKGIALGTSAAGLVDLYSLKATNMAAARRGFFYYQRFAWSQQSRWQCRLIRHR